MPWFDLSLPTAISLKFLSFCDFSFLLELKTNFVFHHYLGLNSVGKEMRSVGADKHKNAIQIKLAFAFFSLQRRITVRFKDEIHSAMVWIPSFLFSISCMPSMEEVRILLWVSGSRDKMVRKTRQRLHPTK